MATITSIAITPSGLSLRLDATQQLVATATYSDGSTADVTSTAVWASSTPSIITVSATGLVTVVQGVAACVSVTATLTVVGSVVVSVLPTYDTYHHVDVSTMTTFTSLTFGYNPSSQVCINLAPYGVEISFDGINGMLLGPVGSPTSGIEYECHFRPNVYIRRVGTGGGAAYLEVYTSI